MGSIIITHDSDSAARNARFVADQRFQALGAVPEELSQI
jgi:hypothetical protein